MLVLHGFGPNFGIEDPSPFVLKVDAFLRMAGIEYKSSPGVHNLQKSPKGKLPFVTVDDKVIADSSDIIDYLDEQYNSPLNSWLSEEQKAQAYLLSKSLDEHWYWCIVHSRWMDDKVWPILKQAFFGEMPFPLRIIVPKVARKQVKGALHAQGLGRFTDDELLQKSKTVLDSLSALLADKTYFFGDKACNFDAWAFAFLAEVILVDLKTPTNDLAQTYTNLVRYCKNIQSLHYN